MASSTDLEIKTRRWRRVEYERLVELGMFTGERLELLNGLLVVREPQGSPHASSVSQVARVLERAFGPDWHAREHAPLALDDDSEPEPDVAMVSGEPLAYYARHHAPRRSSSRSPIRAFGWTAGSRPSCTPAIECPNTGS